MSSASSTAPLDPFEPSEYTMSAPYMRSNSVRSRVTFSGITTLIG
jgi:hypothetical protein